jgi:hypothetical protein
MCFSAAYRSDEVSLFSIRTTNVSWRAVVSHFAGCSAEERAASLPCLWLCIGEKRPEFGGGLELGNRIQVFERAGEGVA